MTERPLLDPAIAGPDATGPAALPRLNGELVFEAPWESRAFGMAVALTQEGAVAWDDFRRELIDEIAAWEREHGPAADGWSYYERWLSSLERLLLSRGLLREGDIDERVARIAHEQAHEHDGPAHEH